MENQKIPIWILYKGRSVKAVNSLAKVPVEQRPEYKKVVFTMRPMTWGANNEMLRKAKRYRKIKGLLIGDVDEYFYKGEKLIWALLAWDYKDDKGDQVPVTEEKINALHDSVVSELLKVYDNLNYLSKDEERRICVEISNYVLSQNSGAKTIAPPNEMVELSLYDRFFWTPDQVDRIGLKRLQTLFVAMGEKENSTAIAREQVSDKAQAKSGKKKKAV